MVERTLEMQLAVQQDRAISTVMSAFANDPVERWLFPDDAAYHSDFPAYIDAVAAGAFEGETAYQQNDYAAVALWIPSGGRERPDDVLRALEPISRQKREVVRTILKRLGRLRPTTPHWHLAWLGVNAHDQSHGIGGSLLNACLARLDRIGMDTYLESPSPRAVPFYQRHGFEIVSEVQVGDCPPLVAMRRPARVPSI